MRAVRVLALALVASCGGIQGGDLWLARDACRALCAVQEHSPGCSRPAACFTGACADEAASLGERCLLAAEAWYECAAQLSWACPVHPDRPETTDDRCAAEQHAWLVCKVTGSPPP